MAKLRGYRRSAIEVTFRLSSTWETKDIAGILQAIGKKTKDYHTQISDVINKTNIDKLFVLGNYSFYTFKNFFGWTSKIRFN